MSIDRTTLRTVVPPILALGLVAVVTHPVDAVDLSPQALPATGARPAVTGTMVASVPAVAFQEHLRVVDGRLHTAVLVNASQPTGRAHVSQLPGCTATLEPGVPAWLDCDYSGRGPVTIDVTLADGRHTTHTAVPVVS